MENRRTTGFLLGLILVLSVLYVGFEYNTAQDPIIQSDRALDEIIQELDLQPMTEAVRPQPQRATTPLQSSPSTSIEHIVAVDMPIKKQIEQLSANTNDDNKGDNTGGNWLNNQTKSIAAQANNAHIATALPRIPFGSNKPTTLRIVDKMPEFPGGASAFMQWLTRQLRYPPIAQRQRIEGKVVVSFIVNTDGSIANVTLEQSVNTHLDQEAIRVIKSMPKWSPGIHNDQACQTMVAVPIIFKI